MKNFQTLLLNLISGLIIPSVSFASEADEIWSYVFLIPIYFILMAQTILVLLASLMKQFKQKKNVILSVSIAGIFMLLGLGITFFLLPPEKLWMTVRYFGLFGVVVIILPVVQFSLLNKSASIPDENET